MTADIERLRAVGRAATDGPWEVGDLGGNVVFVSESGQIITGYEDGDSWVDVREEDAEFCATARNEWDALLDEVEALRAKVARVEAVLTEGPDAWTPYESRDTGWTFMEESVLDFTAEIRAALTGDEQTERPMPRGSK